MTAVIAERDQHEDERHFLAEASRALASSIEYDVTLHTVARVAVSRIADWCGIDVMEHGVLRRVATAHHDPAMEPAAQELLALLRDREATAGITRVVRTATSAVFPAGHPALSGGTARDPEEARLIARLGVSSAIVVPLVHDGVSLGAMTLARAGVGPDYTSADLPLAEEVALRAATAIAHAMLLHETQEARQQLQDQAVELEQQLEELHSQAMLLEEGQAELEELNVELRDRERQLRAEVAERERAEAAARASELRIRAKVEASPIPTYLWRWIGDGLVLEECNSAARHSAGDAIDDAIGKRLHDIYPPDSKVRDDLESCYRDRKVIRREALTHRMLDGNVRTLMVSYAYVAPDTVMVHAEDVTALTHAATSLQESERWVRSVLESAPDIIFVHDLSGVLVDFNSKLATMLGYTHEELWKIDAADLDADHDAEVLRARWAAMQPGTSTSVSGAYRRKDGSRVPVEAAISRITYGGKPVVLSITRDITERVRLEDQLRQAAKMEAVGRLSGGVAHDFNNMLQSIIGHTELLLEGTAAGSPMRDDLEEVRRSAGRAADLTRQLLAFSRQQMLQSRPLSLTQSVLDMQRMLTRMLGVDIEFVTTLAPDAGQVSADPTQVEQVILNLALNARDAMPRGGVLTIEVRNATLTAADLASAGLDGAPGEYVLLEVGDNGQGMDAGTQSRIFDPFYTTKGVGEGTGLGLATVYGIVRQSGGQIRVESARGKGTRFQIHLPRLAEVSPEPRASASPTEVPRGSETILLVEDQDDVRRIAARALRRMGYTVLDASNGVDALRMLREHTGPVALLLTDAVMPHMGAHEVAERARADVPGIRVLCMSGYTPNAMAERGMNPREMEFIQKPFTPSDLAKRVREVLDGA